MTCLVECKAHTSLTWWKQPGSGQSLGLLGVCTEARRRGSRPPSARVGLSVPHPQQQGTLTWALTNDSGLRGPGTGQESPGTKGWSWPRTKSSLLTGSIPRPAQTCLLGVPGPTEPAASHTGRL